MIHVKIQDTRYKIQKTKWCGVHPGAGKWGLAEAAVSWEADEGDTSNTFHIPAPATSIAQHYK